MERRRRARKERGGEQRRTRHAPKVVSVVTLHPTVGELMKVVEVVLASAARGVSSGGGGVLWERERKGRERGGQFAFRREERREAGRERLTKVIPRDHPLYCKEGARERRSARARTRRRGT